MFTTTQRPVNPLAYTPIDQPTRQPNPSTRLPTHNAITSPLPFATSFHRLPRQATCLVHGLPTSVNFGRTMAVELLLKEPSLTDLEKEDPEIVSSYRQVPLFN